MKSVFSVGQGFRVPDGTVVYPCLDPTVLLSHSEGNRADAVSIAVGNIAPSTSSKIHVHPVVTQAIWVLSGRLQVVMKDPGPEDPYALDVVPEQAVVTRPGTFLQLINPGSVNCRVLYIVSPAYLFELDAEGKVAYDDAIVLEETWGDLRKGNWTHPQLAHVEVVREARQRALDRLRARKP